MGALGVVQHCPAVIQKICGVFRPALDHIGPKGLVIFGTPPIKKPVNIEEAFLPVPELQTYLSENPSQTEKGGIGEQRLRQFTEQAIRQSEFENVAIEYDAFVEYYAIFNNS